MVNVRKYKLYLGLSLLSAVVVGILLLALPGQVSAGDDFLPVENGMAGLGTQYHPFEVTNCDDLQNVNLNLDFNYILMNDIDCSDTLNWNGDAGFLPLGLNTDGSNNQSFNGRFDGRNFSITGLYIDQSSNSLNTQGVGLFASTGSGNIFNLNVINAVVIGGNDSTQAVGGVTGRLVQTKFSKVSFDGTIILDCNTQQTEAGGIVGAAQQGSLFAVSSSGDIIANDSCPDRDHIRLGGLAGSAVATIFNTSFSTMAITLDGGVDGVSDRIVGGLVGFTIDTVQILESYASGTLTIAGDPDSSIGYVVGGLVGRMVDTIDLTTSFAATPIVVPDVCSLNCGTADQLLGSLTGVGTVSSYDSDYYDEGVTGVSRCDAAGNTDCIAVNTSGDPDADYFKNNSSNPPLDDWDFDDNWSTSIGTLPNLQDTYPWPDAPTNIVATIASTTSISLQWDPPLHSGIKTLRYSIIECQKEGTTTWFTCDGQNSSGATDRVIYDLEPATHYNFRVEYDNEDGYWGLAATGSGQTASPDFNLVSNCEELQAINENLGANYELAGDIDCSDTINWPGGTGFAPLGVNDGEHGQPDIPFTGIFEGNTHTIRHLFTDQTTTGMLGIGLFVYTQNAVVQDFTLESPIFLSDRPVYAGAVTAIAYSTPINNVQVSDALIEGNFLIVGGLTAGIVTTTDISLAQNSFTGTIHNSGGAAYYMGGMYAYMVLDTNEDPPAFDIVNNYSQATIIDENRAAIVGGMIGTVFGSGDGTALSLTNSYAAGSIEETNTGGNTVTGGLVGTISTVTDVAISNAFAHVQEVDPPGDSTVTGLLVTNTQEGYPDHTYSLSNNYFDADLAGTSDCTIDETVTCSPISGQSSYFYNNTTNPPLNQWDFNHVWDATSTLPVFSAEAVATITEIPEERLHPPATPTVSPATPTASSSPGAGSTTVDDNFNQVAVSTPVEVAQKDTSFIGRLKDLANRIPASVLVSFPYALFGITLVGAGFMFIEMLRQARRLAEVNALIAKQRSIAEQRDTFWHLAANYLRAPITLLMGGIELLQPVTAKSVGAAVAKDAKITARKLPTVMVSAITELVTSMQANVAKIMEQIEQSESLQGIKWPKLEPGQKLLKSLRFWVPLGVVAGLVVFANYIAHGFRHIDASFITYASQIMAFVLVAVVVYWAANGLGLAKRKRERAEKVLAQQANALDTARMSLISKTAEVLDGDISTLDGFLEKLPKKEVAAPILHEGARRLRQMVDSFKLLILSQNHKLAELSPRQSTTSLKKVMAQCLEELESEIARKKLVIKQPDFGGRKVPGSEAALTQVVSSILANAVDFSPEGGTIELGVQDTDSHTFISVADHGPGVSKEQQQHIFQLFTKADGQDALQLDHGGLGINLYLDREIMEYLGGELAVISDEGHGTTVTVRWPKTTRSTAQDVKPELVPQIIGG